MRKFIDIKGKVSLYYNQITIGLQSVTIRDVIVYILEAHSTSSLLKKKKRREKERKEVEKRRRRKRDGKSLYGRKGKRGE